MVAEVLLFEALPPLRLLAEDVRVDLLQRGVQVVGTQLVVVTPELRDVVERLLEVAAAVQHVRFDRLGGAHR